MYLIKFESFILQIIVKILPQREKIFLKIWQNILSKNLEKNIWNLVRKKISQYSLTEKSPKNEQKALEKMHNVSIHLGNSNLKAMRYYYITTRVNKMKKKYNDTKW